MKVSQIINELVYRHTGSSEHILLPDGIHIIDTDGFSEAKVQKLIKAFMAFDEAYEGNPVWSLTQTVWVKKNDNNVVVNVFHEEIFLNRI